MPSSAGAATEPLDEGAGRRIVGRSQVPAEPPRTHFVLSAPGLPVRFQDPEGRSVDSARATLYALAEPPVEGKLELLDGAERLAQERASGATLLFAGLAPRAYALRCEAAGRPTLVVSVLLVEAGRPAADDEVVVRFEQPTRLRGVVRGPFGGAVEDAKVFLVDANGELDTDSVDDEGEFWMTRVKPGPVRIVAAAPGWKPSALTAFEARAGARYEELVLVLRDVGSLQVVVHDQDGRPLSDARVAFVPEVREGSFVEGWPRAHSSALEAHADVDRRSGQTDANGECLLEALRPGPGELRVEYSGDGSDGGSATYPTSARFPVQVAPSTTTLAAVPLELETHVLTVELDPPPAGSWPRALAVRPYDALPSRPDDAGMLSSARPGPPGGEPDSMPRMAGPAPPAGRFSSTAVARATLGDDGRAVLRIPRAPVYALEFSSSPPGLTARTFATPEPTGEEAARIRLSCATVRVILILQLPDDEGGRKQGTLWSVPAGERVEGRWAIDWESVVEPEEGLTFPGLPPGRYELETRGYRREPERALGRSVAVYRRAAFTVPEGAGPHELTVILEEVR